VLRAEGSVPLADMLFAESHLFPRGTTVIVVTPTVREEWATNAAAVDPARTAPGHVLIDPGSLDLPVLQTAWQRCCKQAIWSPIWCVMGMTSPRCSAAAENNWVILTPAKSCAP
jgi:hypothetical protein